MQVAVPESIAPSRGDVEELVRELAGCTDTVCSTYLDRIEDRQFQGHYPLEIFRFVHNGEEQRVIKSLGFDPPEFFDIAVQCFVEWVKGQHGRAYRSRRPG